MVNVMDGASYLLWDDLWLNRVPKQHFSELFSYKEEIYLDQVSNRGRWPWLLVSSAHFQCCSTQLTELAEDLTGLQEITEKDFWSYIWGSPFFSSAKAYVHLTCHRIIHDAFKWLWKWACQNKHMVSFWLLLKDILSIRELLRRNMVLPAYTCVCWSLSVEESLVHLFIHCLFAQVVGV